MKRRQVAARHTFADQGAAVDVGLELQFSARPGPVFVPGATYSVPAPVVSGMRQMLTRMVTSDQWPPAVALTSALRGEGVSYTALALSAVLSQDTTKSVCLVDTNWYWPSAVSPVTRSVESGGSQAGGLAGVLDGGVTLDQALVRVQDSTAMDGAPVDGVPLGSGGANAIFDDAESRLMLMPAGDMPQRRRVIAARSPELKAAVAELKARFDYLVFDVPAILATSDAIALAGLADACCLVVHQGVTPAPTVQEALAAIRHLPVAGVILNHFRVYMPAALASQLTAPVENTASAA